jgi:Deoxyhypusine synthase
MTRPTPARLAEWEAQLSETSRKHLNQAVDQIVAVKQHGGTVVAVTGSGPNIHEGVTTLIAELIQKGVIDGVLTSSAVVAHEMAGTLDRIKRIRAADHPDLQLPPGPLPRGSVFEITELTAAGRAAIQGEIEEGWELYDRIAALPGDTIIKAAGNMAWPMGPRTERLAREGEAIARDAGVPFERVAGHAADPYTMIGAGARRGVPVLVSIPQLVGGGAVGLAIGDTISITRRARLVAETLAAADVIVESAIALSQEIHDGPYETYTGHGIWSAWEGEFSYSLRSKTLVRIDLDPNLENAWLQERQSAQIQAAVDRGLPKTKITGIPFRMEMSGFARLESSLPVTADIGIAWPILAAKVAGKLGVALDFLSAPQETSEGKEMRAWISENVRPLDRTRMHEAMRALRAATGDA